MTSVSKNVYIDKLDDIINKYSSTYHSTIKCWWNLLMKNQTHILNLAKKLMIKILNFELITILKFQYCENIKI